MTLGEKIRARRIELHLKQSEVANGTVTKNMICRLEKGDCSPSLATLSAIAESLSVPVAYLLSDSDDLDRTLAEEKLPSLRCAFSEERFADAASILEKIPATAAVGEIAALGAETYLRLAERAISLGNFKPIPGYLSLCRDYCDRTIGNTAWIRARAELCRAVCDNPQTPKWEIEREKYAALADEAVGFNRYLYLSEDTLPLSERLFLSHREAKEKMGANRYSEALSILLSIEEEKTSGKLDPYFLFRVYSDTETCYRELGDYENAYRYSTKRISLLNGFMN